MTYRVSPLARITHATADAEATNKFYSGLMNLEESKLQVDAELQAAQRQLWGLAEDVTWSESLFRRTAFPETPLVRVLAMDQPGPPVRPDMDVLLHGGLSVGFSSRDREELAAFVDHASEMGIDTTAGITTIDLNRPDGSAYQALETHFIAPDFVYGLGVGRPDDLPKVAPIADGEPVGGPAYSAQVCNHVDADLDFYRDVMGFEVRRDVPLISSGPEGGLNLAPNTEMRFIQIYAPGTETAYLVILDFADGGKENPVATTPPNTGVVMWTFRTTDLDETLAAVGACDGAQVVGEASDIVDEGFGRHRAACVKTPRGFLIELIQT